MGSRSSVRRAGEWAGPSRASPLLAALSLALALAGPAAASPRLAVAPVKGDPKGDVGAQLLAVLCADHRCIPGALEGKGPRLERAWKRRIDAAVFASVSRDRSGRELSVALFTRGDRSPARTWRLRLGRSGLLPRDQLGRLAAEIGTALGRPAEPPAPAAPSPLVAPRAPPELPSSAPAAASAPRSPSAPGAMETVPIPVVAIYDPPLPPPPTRGKTGHRADLPPWFAAEVGVEAARSWLGFPSGGTAPVGYTLDARAVPLLRLEAHPLRESGGPAAGAGLFAEVAYLPGMSLPAGALTYRADSLRLRGGVGLRLQAGLATLEPAVAWELERLTVSAAGGARLPGLPDTRLSGPSAGVDVSLPLGATAFSLVAGGRLTWWLQAGELAGGVRFYPGGTALGFRLEAGAGLHVAGPLSARLVGSYAATFWWLDQDPSGAFTARSARAGSWGIRAWFRLEV